MKPRAVVYFQGRYKCKIIKDHGDSVSYVALEGYEPSYDGGVLIVAKENSFTEKRKK